MEQELNRRRGERSELAVASGLMGQGYGVSFPFGHDYQYDLIVDVDGDLYRVQVKTAKHEGGNRYYIPAEASKYESDVDLLAGYRRDIDTSFFIPIGEASGNRQRVTFTDPDQMGSDESRERARHISDYTFETAIERL